MTHLKIELNGEHCDEKSLTIPISEIRLMDLSEGTVLFFEGQQYSISDEEKIRVETILLGRSSSELLED